MSPGTTILFRAAVSNVPRRILGGMCALLLIAELTGWPARGEEKSEATSRIDVALQEPKLTESSGLAVSRRAANRFWTHNDSGGKPRLYAFHKSGRATGRCDLAKAKAEDWEDIASFVDEGVARLLVADCGDNQGRRKTISLYLLDEPDPDTSSVTNQWSSLTVTYQDGPRDCEAVAVDVVRRQIVLITKSRFSTAGIYVVPLPRRETEPDSEEANAKQEDVSVVAKRVGTVFLPMVTGADIDPMTGDFWLVTYLQLFRFPCQQRREPMGRQFSRTPQATKLRSWKQVEAVAVDRAGSVWITTEGSPAILARPEVSEASAP